MRRSESGIEAELLLEEEDNINEVERVLRMILPGDDFLDWYTCSRVNGLDKQSVLVVLCRSNLYIIENYRILQGELVEVDPAQDLEGEMSGASNPKFSTWLSTRDPEDGAAPDHDKLVLKVQKQPKSALQSWAKNPAKPLEAGVDSAAAAEGTEGGPRGSESRQLTKEELHRCQRWSFGGLRELHKRRYQLQTIGIELFYSNGTNFLLVFEKTAERDDVYTRLMGMATAGGMFMHSLSSQLGVKPKTDAKQPKENTAALIRRYRKQVQRRWVKGELSNFAYLMFLNTLAGRSYNDLTQYPVFPWILKDYDSAVLDLNDPGVYRDLTKPMGAIGEKRAEEFQARYDNWEDPSGLIPQFHYGTHYSSAATVLYYLLRLEPFTKTALQLQGGRFDHADRLYHDLGHTWHSASQAGGMSDVKELIPEFFYLPEFLENRNNFDMGNHQKGGFVDDVKLPPWAKGDARLFIRLHRRALESPAVSASIHHWIDLIFGQKQKGKKAVAAQNVFYYLTYEGSVDIDSITDPMLKMATIAQINNFGQTPTQLFRKAHPQRQKVSPPVTIVSHVHMLRPQTDKMICLPNGVGDMCFWKDKLVLVDANKALIPNRSKYLSWGHVDYSLRFQTLAPSPRHRHAHEVVAVHENLHDGQITRALVLEDGTSLLTCGTDGAVKLWAMDRRNKHTLTLRKSLCAHAAPITCAVASADYSIFVTGGADGNVIIWDANNLLLTRKLPLHPGPLSCVAVHPGTGEILTCAGAHLWVWSINGELSAEHKVSDAPSDCITSAAFAVGPEWVDESLVITGHHDGFLRFFRLELPLASAPASAYTSTMNFDAHEDRTSSGGLVSTPGAGTPEILARCARPAQPRQRLTSLEEEEDTDPEFEDDDIGDRPHYAQTYMSLRQVDQRDGVHSSAVTHIYTPGASAGWGAGTSTGGKQQMGWTKLWTGDQSGLAVPWSMHTEHHWIKDSETKQCMQCAIKFSLSLRRHHCRSCGQVFCGNCSSKKASVSHFGYKKPVRVCDKCYGTGAKDSKGKSKRTLFIKRVPDSPKLASTL